MNYRRLLVFFLLFFTVFNIYRLPTAGYKILMNDFKTIYTAGRAFTHNRNPYFDHVIKSSWREISQRQNLSDQAAPGLPETPFVYPPGILLCLQPITWLDYPIAKGSFFGLNLIFLSGIFLLLARMGGFLRVPKPDKPVTKRNKDSRKVAKTQRTRKGYSLCESFASWRLCVKSFPIEQRFYRLDTHALLVCGLVILGLKGTRLGLVAGQMVFFSFFFCLLSYGFAKSGRPLQAGFCLALALLKYTFALPFLLFFLIAGKYKIALLAVCIFVIFSAIALAGMPAGTLQTYLASVQSTLAGGGINDFSFANERFFGLTGLHGLLYFLFRSRMAVWIISAILFLSPGFFVWKYRDSFLRKNENLLLLFTFYSLLFTYHRIYDSIGLLAVFLVCKPSVLFASIRWKAVFLLPLFMPVTGLVLQLKPILPHELFHILAMDVPLSLIALFVVWLEFLDEKICNDTQVEGDHVPQNKTL